MCRTLQTTTVADFGASELTFVHYLKNIDFVNQIYAVDIDHSVLDRHKLKCKPLMFDYLNKRAEPLNISVLCGSVLEYDSRLQGLDCICCIELIEHLQLIEVEQFLRNLFGRLRPKFAVITTPNKDFNVLFDFESSQMRHWDHKFEWTREEFQYYCDTVKQYGYKYELFGVGDPPEEHSHLGYCSQGALFTRLDAADNAQSSDIVETSSRDTSRDLHLIDSFTEASLHHPHDCLLYKEVYSVDYPIADASLTPDYHLTNELVYQSRNLGQHQYMELGEEVSEISIAELQTFSCIAQYDVSNEHVADLVRQSDLVHLSEDGINIVVRNIPDSPEFSSDSDSNVSDLIASEISQLSGDEAVW